MRIAVIGCSHGTLDDIYASVERCNAEAVAKNEPTIDLMICCGDFQAMRAPPDLHAMAAPPKYRALGQFHNYYAERKKAPCLTIVIGGNHESSGYMWELYHGGWLAPDIYFLGFAGCLLVDGWLRIAGASGIWKSGDFRRGHYETVPFDDRTIRSVYHIREYDVARLLQLKTKGPNPDVFMSHDWPLGIEQHGDTGALIREKPFFKDEIHSNTLGSPPLHALLTSLQPSYWFSAHLHVKFAALYKHSGAKTVVKRRAYNAPTALPPPAAATMSTTTAAAAGVEEGNPDEIALVVEDEDDEEPKEVVGIVHLGEGNPEEFQIDDDEQDEDGDVGQKEVVVLKSLKVGENPEEIQIDDLDEDDDIEGEGEENEIVSEEKEGCDCSGSSGQHSHNHERQTKKENPDEIDVVMDEDEDDEKRVEDAVVGDTKGKGRVVDGEGDVRNGSGPRETKFLALSKPGFGKDFLQIVDIPEPEGFERAAPPPSASSPRAPSIDTPTPPIATPAEFTQPSESLSLAPDATTPLTDSLLPALSPPSTSTPPPHHRPTLYFDPYWLSIMRTFNPYLSLKPQPIPFPPLSEVEKEIEKNLEWVRGHCGVQGKVKVEEVQTFVRTAPATGEGRDSDPPSWYTNPQTVALCALLDMENKINPVPAGFEAAQAAAKVQFEAEEARREEEKKEELKRMKEEALRSLDVEGEAEGEGPVAV